MYLHRTCMKNIDVDTREKKQCYFACHNDQRWTHMSVVMMKYIMAFDNIIRYPTLPTKSLFFFSLIFAL